MKRLTCIQCGKSFNLTDSEIEFYESRGLSLPKRCKECREKNKHNKNKNKFTNKGKPPKTKYKKYTVKVGNNKLYAKISAVTFILSMIVFFLLFKMEHIFVYTVGSIILSSIVASIVAPRKSLLIEEFDTSNYKYNFYDVNSLKKHYIKHYDVVDEKGMEEYLIKANLLISNPRALHKKTSDDNDDVYFNRNTNEIVIVAKAGYIRTYFIASEKYYNKQ